MRDTILNSDAEIFQRSWLHISLSSSRSLSLGHTYLTSPATSAHANRQQQQQQTRLVPSHEGRQAIVWTGLMWGKWNRFPVYRSLVLFRTAACFHHLSVRACWFSDSSGFEQCDEFGKQWHAEQHNSFLLCITEETNIGFCLLLTRSKQRAMCQRCKCAFHRVCLPP